MSHKALFAAGLWMVLHASFPLQAQIDYRIRSQEQLMGRSAEGDVEFTSFAESQDFVVVSLVIQDSTEIRAEIDYGKQEVKVRASLLGSSRLSQLSAADRIALARLAGSADWGQGSRTEEALLSTLNFLQSSPPGKVVDFSSPKSQALGKKSYRSLCERTGSSTPGTYTIGSQTHSESAQLGPCYSEPNQCLGRCGAGCKRAPGDSVQRFTQECFNHDLCTRMTGDRLGECFDEFTAAIDGFFFAPDCGTLQDTWIDNYGFRWELVQTSIVRGQVQTGSCSSWGVTGNHKGAEIKLIARNPDVTDLCCQSFTYTGRAIDCNSASGTWVNGGCKGSGSWTMVRKGSTVQLQFTDGDGNSSVPGVRH